MNKPAPEIWLVVARSKTIYSSFRSYEQTCSRDLVGGCKVENNQVFAVIGSQLYAEFASKCFADLVTSAFVLVLFQAGKVSSKATQPVL